MRARSKDKYLRMIRGMKKGRRKDWSVYILRCGDGSFYTGIAKDLSARVKKHGAGKGAAYTRSRLPVELIFRESPFTRSEALVREWQIKQLPRPKKEKLILEKAQLAVETQGPEPKAVQSTRLVRRIPIPGETLVAR